MNRRNLVFWALLGSALLVVGFVTSGRRNETGQPLDPDSTAALGTRGLVELLERFDASVTRGLPDDRSTVVLVLIDQLTTDQRADLERWVEDGGTVVVADPGSPLSPDLAFPVIERRDTLRSGACSVAALDGLELEAGTFLLYDSAAASSTCFADDAGAFVHVVEMGQGRVVSIGGAIAVTNQYLDEGDNAVLAVELLIPGPERSTVAVLFEPILAPGSRTLSDLIPSSARWAAAQLLVAVAVMIFWKARRFGRPVIEAQPVKLPGSLLVRASGELRRRSGGFASADRVLRRHHEQTLCRRLKLPADLPVSELLTATIAASGVDRTTVERSLTGPVAASGAALVELVEAIDRVRDGLDEAEALPTLDLEVLAPAPVPQPAGERL